MKEFTKSDLKNRMVVECRNGLRYIVVDEYLLGKSGYNELEDFTADLRCEKNAEFDIAKVYEKTKCLLNLEKDSPFEMDIIWQRPEVKEITMAEVEEKFGCKVKIVNNN